MDNSKDKAPLRVFLWGVPRTLSTVFEKCLSHVDGIQIINEPYVYAQFFGPESKLWQDKAKESAEQIQEAMSMGNALEMSTKPGWFHESICTYKWVKDTLEADYPGKSIIFSKDMSQSADHQMMARGFRHTFIIRHPHKVWPSAKKVMCKLHLADPSTFRYTDLPEPFLSKGYGYGEQYALIQHVQQHGDPNPVIIDADDLQSSPASILRQYCEAVGIPFNESLLQWPAGTDICDEWIVNSTFMAINKTSAGGFYDAAFNSTCFLPPSKIPSREDLPEDLLPLVDASMPFYEKMYEMRMKP